METDNTPQETPEQTRRYRVTLQTVASYTVIVDATDELEAMDLAYEDAPTLCAHCSGWGDRPGIDLGEWGTEGFTVRDEVPELVEDEAVDQ